MRLVTALFCLFSSSQGQTIEGLPALDQISFDKIVNKFEYSLIKFDVGYPTGDKHSAFGTLSKEVERNNPDHNVKSSHKMSDGGVR